MQLNFLETLLRKVDVDFLNQEKKSDLKSQMSVKRVCRFQTKDEAARLVVRGEYEFPVNGRNQIFIFDSIFSLTDHAGFDFDDVEEIFLEKIADVVDPIITPQEVRIIKDHISLYGGYIKSGIPAGVPVNVY